MELAVGIDGDIEPGRFDVVHPPSVDETGPDLVLGDAARSPVARLELAEAEHEVAATDGDHRSQVVDERWAVVVLEDVEQSAVEHRVELFIKGGQFEGVPDQEAGAATPVPGFALGGLDGACGHIDA